VSDARRGAIALAATTAIEGSLVAPSRAGMSASANARGIRPASDPDLDRVSQ